MEQVQHDRDAAEVAREAADDAPPSEAPEDQAVHSVDALHVDTNADADVSPPLSSTNATAPTATLTARLSHVQRANSFASSSSNTASPLRLVATVNAVSSSSGASGTKQQVFFIKTSDSPSSIHSERSRHHVHSHSRKVTRDIAALDFLQNIPMRSEHLHGNHHSRHNNHGNNTANKQDPSDSQNGNKSHKKKKNATDGSNAQSTGNNDNNNNSSSASDGADSMKLQGSGSNNESLAGRRLPGFDATIVHVPPLFRYRFTTKYPAASAVVRRWEGMTAQQGLLGSRAYFSSGCGYPIATSTIIKYNGNETSALRKRFASVGNLEPMSYDWRGKSYFRLLHATWAACDKDRDSQEDHPTAVAYMANYLDDPEFRQGRHRHVVRGDKNIGPIVSSILLFVKPNDLKEELNKKFQEKHTWLNGDLSLSKIRNLKRETLSSCQRLNLEVATAAMACVYFEKLVLSHFVTVQSINPQFVNKSNRKLYMAACLLLAAKFNEPKASDAMKTVIKKILEEIDQVHSIPSREVLTAEFTVYAQLSFSLHIPLCEIQPHFTRLLKLIESNPRKYLDEDVFSSYSILVLDEKNAQLRLDAAAGGGGARSFDGETHDEGTDLEALLSDEEEQLGVHGDEDDDEEDDPSLFPWNRVSFAQWWKKRRGSGGGGRRDATAAAKKTTVASALSSPIHE